MLNRDVKLDIPCENCGHKTSFKIKEIEKSPDYVCTNCSSLIHLDASNFKKSLADVENQLKKTFKFK